MRRQAIVPALEGAGKGEKEVVTEDMHAGQTERSGSTSSTTQTTYGSRIIYSVFPS